MWPVDSYAISNRYVKAVDALCDQVYTDAFFEYGIDMMSSVPLVEQVLRVTAARTVRRRR